MPKGIYERKEKGTYPHGTPYHMAQRKGAVGNPKAPARANSNPRPTKKQVAAVDAILAKPTVELETTIAEVGYAPGERGSNVPAVVGSKGFLDYLNERVPDEELSRLINEGTSAEKAPSRYDDFSPDWGNRFKFIELVTRLKGYQVSPTAPTVTVQFTNGIPRPSEAPEQRSGPSIDVDSIPEADLS